jgi:hypothetical protein
MHELSPTKHLFLVHRWGGNVTVDWYPFLAKSLNESVAFHSSDYPEPTQPVAAIWVEHLRQQVQNELERPQTTLKSDLSNAYFVGHSVGTQTIMRYFAELPIDKRVGGAVLVAGWMLLNDPFFLLKPWLDPFDFDRVKTVTKDRPMVALVSDNDNFTFDDVMLQSNKLLREQVNAKIVMCHHQFHFRDEGNMHVVRAVHKMLNI